MNVREVHSFREVLSQQTIGVLVRATLPGLLRITEVHLNVGRQAEALVIGHLLAKKVDWKYKPPFWQFRQASVALT